MSIRLHRGHEAAIPWRRIHESMQSLQNSCMHGSSRTSSPSPNSPRQMEHVGPSSPPSPLSPPSAGVGGITKRRHGNDEMALRTRRTSSLRARSST